MAIEVVADEHYAGFVQTTSNAVFGPAITVPNGSARDHRLVAEGVIEHFQQSDTSLAVAWERNPALVRRVVSEVKHDLGLVPVQSREAR